MIDSLQASKRDRQDDIDRGKGLAIVLVVLGHIVARDLKPAGNEWYAEMNAVLYTFHMAFFFYLSGVVTFLRGELPVSPGNYWDFLKKKAERLLPAYLVFALIVFFGKWAAANLINVDRKVSLSSWEAVELVIHPTQSYASFLWYIFALLLVYASVPVWLWLLRNKPWLLVAWTLALNLIGGPELLGLHQVARYSLFFALGWLWVLHRAPLSAHLDRFWMVWLGAFVGGLFLLPKSALPLMASLLSIPALHGLARQLTGKAGRLFGWLGRYSFSIYLMNGIAMGLVKGVMLKVLPWDGINFILFFPILWLTGLMAPVAIKKWLFPRFPFFDRITR